MKTSALYAIARKVIDDGNAYGFDAWRKQDGFLRERAVKYSIAEPQLAEICSDVERLSDRPTQDVVEQVVARAQARGNGARGG